MVSKVIITLCLLVAVAAAVPAVAPPWGGAGLGGAGWPGAGGVNPWIPPWIAAAPWFPQWSPCTTIGRSCVDCNTRLICTKMYAGMQRTCTDPTMPHCNLGECSATPSAECAVPVVPANAA